MLRRWLLIVLCFAMPLPGVARIDAGTPPCPMQAMMEAALAAGEVAADELPDCCHDLETFALTGQACKPAPDGGAPVAWLPPAPDATSAPPARELGAGPPASMHRPGPAAAIWRPPTRV